MEIIFFLSLLLYLFVVGSCIDYVDYDFFARLIVGKTFFQTGDVLKYDFLSYTPTHPWYDHEWGASLIFYFIQEHFGDVGLQALKALCLFGMFFFFVKIIQLRRKILSPDKKFPILNFFFFFLMLQPISNLVFSLRCHHFTFFFFSIWLYVLEKARLEKNYRILWVLPLLMVIWSNIHGGCFMALGITGIYVIGEFLRKKPFMPYIYVILASFAGMFINPYGIDYVIFLIKATTMTRPNIIEWQSPFSPYFLTKLIKFKLVLIGFMILSLYRFTRIKTDENINRMSKYDFYNIFKIVVIALLGSVLNYKVQLPIAYIAPFLVVFTFLVYFKEIKNIWKNTDKKKFLIMTCAFLSMVFAYFAGEFLHDKHAPSFVISIVYLLFCAVIPLAVLYKPLKGFEGDKTKFLLVFVTFLLTLKSMRFISYFVFILIPFCHDDFYEIFSKRLSDKWNKAKEIIIFALILLAFIANITIRDLRYGNWHSIYPLSEIEYLIENNVKGNVFIPFECGSYAAYKLYPNNFILQDGRYEEVYGLDINDDYVKTISLGALGWREKFNSIHHDIVIPYKHYALYNNLKNDPNYYNILESRTFALFIRKDKWEEIKKPVRIPTDNPNFYRNILWNSQIDWRKK